MVHMEPELGAWFPNYNFPLRCLLPALILMLSGGGCSQRAPASGNITPTKAAPLPLGAAGQKLSGDMAFSPNGRTLAVANYDGAVRLLDLATGTAQDFKKPIRNERSEFNKVVYSKHGQLLAISYRQDEILLIEAAGTNVKLRIPMENAAVYGSVFTDRDQTLLALTTSVAKDAPPEPPLNLPPWTVSAVRWDVSTGQRKSSVNLGVRLVFRTLSPEGRFAALVAKSEWGKGSQNKYCVFDLTTGKRVLDLGDDDDAGYCVFAADGSALLRCRGNRLSFLEMPSGKELKHFEVDPPFGPSGYPLYLSVAPNGSVLAVGSHPGPGSASLISLESGRFVGGFDCGGELSICIRTQISADGRIFATQTGAANQRDQFEPPSLRVWRVPAKL